MLDALKFVIENCRRMTVADVRSTYTERLSLSAGRVPVRSCAAASAPDRRGERSVPPHLVADPQLVGARFEP
jgi:hypothetical protein